MDLICPCLYEDNSRFAFSRPAVETKRVLASIRLACEPACEGQRGEANDIPTTPSYGEVVSYFLTWDPQFRPTVAPFPNRC